MPTDVVTEKRKPKRHRRRVCRCGGWAAASVLLLVPLLAVPAAAQSAGSGAGPAAVSVDRFGGADRYATSLAVAEGVAAGAGGSLASVVIVSGERWRDAVVAAPLAAAGGSGRIAPVLLSHSRTGLSADAWAFIERVSVGGAVIVSTDAAGRWAVPGSVDDGLRERGVFVQRVGGSDAYATSVAVADAVSVVLSGSSGSQGSGGSSGVGGTVFVASGESFADALVAGPLVGNAQAAVPLLLTPKQGLDAAVSGWLARHQPARAVIMGGTAAVSAQVEAQIEAAGVRTVERIAGSDRFDTAAKAAAWAATHIAPGCGGPGEAGLARSDVPFDSFSAGPLLALRCAPLLLTAPGRIPDATAAALDTALDRADPQGTPRLNVFGGEAAVSTSAIEVWLNPSDDDPAVDDEVSAAAIAAAEQQMVRLVNALRASVGIDALTVSAEIAGVARGWSRTMLATGELEHNPNYSAQYPPGWLSSGENVATASGYPSIADAVEVMFDGLVNSPGHYANMTSPAFTHIGIGIGIGSDGDKHYATQNFAEYPQTQPSGAGSSNGTIGAGTPGTSTVAALEAPPALSPGLSASVGAAVALRAVSSARWWDTSVIRPKSGSEVVTVFLCDLDGDSRTQDMHAATKTLNDRVSPFYKWQSSDVFQFIFEPGAVLRPNSASTCLDAAEQHASSASYVVIARGTDAAANTGFGWIGRRASKAAVVIGSDGPTGLEANVSQYHRAADYHLMSVIDALAHTHLGVGFYSNRFVAEQGGTPLLAGCVSPLLGILGDLEVPSLVSQQNPSGYTVRLSCWEIGLLGWPRHRSSGATRDGNCYLLPAEGVQLKTRDIGEESVKLTWHAPEARPYSHPLAAYRIEHYEHRTGNEDSFLTPKSIYRVDADVREFTITGMSPVKSHGVHVYTEYKPIPKQLTSLDSKFSRLDNNVFSRGVFSPRARSATLVIDALRPTVRDADKVTPGDMDYSMKWEPHPEAVEYLIMGLGGSPFTRHTEFGLETSEISGSTGGSIVRTPEYRIDGWLDQLAFDTEYDLVVLACMPVRFVWPVSFSSPNATTCFVYISKPFTTPTEQEFREYVASFAPPVFDPNWTHNDIVWDRSAVAPTDVPSNLQITSVSRHHDSANAPNALVLTFAWEEASAADAHRIYNPTRNEPVPSDATDFEGHIWNSHAYHSDSSPQTIVMIVDPGSSVTFEYEACNVGGRWPNGWPASYVCGPTQTAVLPIPQP